ncbi:hypothetical protein C5167_023083 [Papaver somniferum]|uniref:Uncharacterized protein n=1 Tax=Papaver somniferum TaxID=3469 RepID=A0A4Y7JJM2_PAPSO|nr:hypothetical protein C5167_023083 [Papaver somniferum]
MHNSIFNRQWGSSSKYLHLSCGCLQFVFNVTTFMQGASLRLIFFDGGSKEIWEAKFITLKSLELNFQSDIIGCWEGLSVSSNQLQAVNIWKMIWIIATTRIGMLNAMVKAIDGLCSFIHLEASTLWSKHSAVLVVLIQSSQVRNFWRLPPMNSTRGMGTLVPNVLYVGTIVVVLKLAFQGSPIF